MTIISDVNFTIIFDLLGTFAFAISGIKLASGKNIDWFGAYIIGLVTAIGGGTMRDLLLDVNPFWMHDAKYLITTGVALLAALLFKEKLFKWGNTLFLFDTIGLGLFTIVGISKSLDVGLPFWVCIIMGAITGSLGGVLRDVLINEVPLLFRKDIYALACIAGGIVYFVCYKFEILSPLSELIAALTVIFIRIVAVKFHLQLPILSTINDKHYKKQNDE
ncbi:MAG: trimeric intracellular cation channel family protein [Ignavibacteriales bacterium]|nr:trimeric intracellular cation channel family protein [Ignavibacteriales bacterium]